MSIYSSWTVDTVDQYMYDAILNPKIKNYCISVLDRFVAWYDLEKPDKYYPDGVLVSMYAKDDLKHAIIMLKYDLPFAQLIWLISKDLDRSKLSYKYHNFIEILLKLSIVATILYAVHIFLL